MSRQFLKISQNSAAQRDKCVRDLFLRDNPIEGRNLADIFVEFSDGCFCRDNDFERLRDLLLIGFGMLMAAARRFGDPKHSA